MKKHNDLIDLLNKTFPELLAVDGSEFSTDYEKGDGMWFRGSEEGKHSDKLPLFDYYMEFGIHRDTDGVHPALAKMLYKHGYYSEPQDPATLMAGRI